MGSAENVAGMARFGINTSTALGIGVPPLRKLAGEIKRELREPAARHVLAADLWRSGVHEARALAAMVDDPRLVTPEQMEEWVQDLDSWDVCDGVCAELFDKTPYAYEKAVEWAGREPEFERRAAFSLIAALARHDKAAPDERFVAFFPLIKEYASDDRNFVKKAVNWALREIGKRNQTLMRRTIEVAREMEVSESRSARWVARDAIRELTARLE